MRQRRRILFFVLVLGMICVRGIAQNSAQPAKRSQAEVEVRLVPQLGHHFDVYSVAFSSDDRYAVTGGIDHTAKLWDVQTGTEIRTFSGHKLAVTSVAFSSDGRYVLTGSDDHTAKLWETQTGNEIRTFSGHTDIVQSVAFSPDGRQVLTGSIDRTVKLWDIWNGVKSTTFSGHAAGISAVAFSSDGRYVLTGSQDHSAKIWDVRTGAEIRTFSGHMADVNSVALSPDNRYVLTGSQDHTAKLWHAQTGTESRTFSGHTADVESVAFSPDGRFILTGSLDYTAKLWDPQTGVVIRTFTSHLHGDVIHSAVFSSDGRFVLTGNLGDARLWDARTAAEIRTFAGHAVGAEAVVFSPDGRYILAGNEDGKARLWEIQMGAGIRTFSGHAFNIGDVAFSPDGRYFLTGSLDSTAKLWDAQTGTNIRTFSGYWDTTTFVAYSPDGRFILTGSDDDNAILWDARTGAEIRTFSGLGPVAFSPDGRCVLAANYDVAALSDAQTGAEIRTFSGHSLPISSLAFSPDGRFVLTGSSDRTAKLWDAQTGVEIRTFSGHTAQVESVAFSPDGLFILTGSFDSTTRLWDAQTGAAIRTLSGHSSWVNSVAFSPDGRFVLTGSYDGTAKIWETQTGREICSLISFDDGTWAVVDPDGRFDTNNLEEMKGLHWVISDDPMNALPLEIFMRDYYEPRLLSRLMNGERFAAIRSLRDLNRTQPEVRIADVSAQADGKASVIVEVAKGKAIITQNGKPVDKVTDVFDLRLFRDGQLVASSERTGSPAPDSDLSAWRERHRISVDTLTGRTKLVFKDIKLPRKAGKTAVEFTAYAFNEDRVKSATARKAFDLPQSLFQVKGRAYVIAMGVNASQNPAWELRYAANDARKMQRSLLERLKRNPDYDEVVTIRLISDRLTVPDEARATKSNLKAVLDLLAGRPVPDSIRKEIPGGERIREAAPNDLVIINFSGHGLSGEHGIFYLMPEDLGPGRERAVTPDILAHCVSSEELAEWLQAVDAGDMALIVDACHSAASVESAGFKPGPMGSRGLGQLAFDKGMRILAATQADSVALESGRLEQGLLSYALVEDGLLHGKADFAPVDRAIMLSEWMSYGTKRVPALLEEIRSGKIQSARGVKTAMESGNVQQPALFDFTRGRRDVRLDEKR